MTYEYNDIDQGDALYNAAREYPGGIPALAQRMCMSANTLKKKLSPAVDSHVLGYEEASRVIELLDEVKPEVADQAVQAFNWRHGRIAFRLPNGGDVDADRLLMQLGKTFANGGKLSEEITKALSDDACISGREKTRIEERLQAVIEDLVTLRNEVREKHKRDTARRQSVTR